MYKMNYALFKNVLNRPNMGWPPRAWVKKPAYWCKIHWFSGKYTIRGAGSSKEGHAESLLGQERTNHCWFFFVKVSSAKRASFGQIFKQKYFIELLSYNIYIYIYIYIHISSWPSFAEGNQKAPFSIATTPGGRGRCYSFLWIAPLTLDPYLIMMSVKEISSTNLLSLWYDLTWDWTLVSRTCGEHSTNYAYIYIYMCVCACVNISTWFMTSVIFCSIYHIFLKSLTSLKLEYFISHSTTIQ